MLPRSLFHKKEILYEEKGSTIITKGICELNRYRVRRIRSHSIITRWRISSNIEAKDKY